MKKLLFCLLFGLVTGLYANTGYKNYYWRMPEQKAIVTQNLIKGDSCKHNNKQINIYYEKGNTDLLFFCDESLDFIVRTNTDYKESKINEVFIKSEIFENLNINITHPAEIFIILFSICVNISNIPNDYILEKETGNYIKFEFYEYNKDTMLTKINFQNNDKLEILSMYFNTFKPNTEEN